MKVGILDEDREGTTLGRDPGRFRLSNTWPMDFDTIQAFGISDPETTPIRAARACITFDAGSPALWLAPGASVVISRLLRVCKGAADPRLDGPCILKFGWV